MKIQYIKHEDIDKTKWNSCVHYAPNGNIFGYKWYLDNVAKEWDALIENDYESVMPLPYKNGKLLKNSVLYQPSLIRELGIYSINILSPKRINAFLDKIPTQFRRVSMNLNERIIPTEQEKFAIQEFQNHQLLLSAPYEELANSFSRPLLLQLEQSEQHGLRPSNQLKPEVLADFYKQYHPAKKKSDYDYHALMRIMWNALHRGWGFSAGVFDDNKELLAANFFLLSHHKTISLMPTVSPKGKDLQALPYLFNKVLQTSAGKPSILDFNTFEPNELALGFGAQQNTFYQIRKKAFFV